MDRGPESVEQVHARVKRNFRLAGVAAVLILGMGTVFYHLVERLSWLDAVYFSTITLTTVGYGDITPHTAIGKIFTIFYVLAGIGTIATFANLLIKNAMLRRERRAALTKAGKPRS